jgi:hypothetical protein
MRVLADFAMRGRWQAVGSVAVLGALGVFVPPVSILGGALVALVALRLGLVQALFVAGLGSLILGALMFGLTGGNPLVGVLAGLAQWLPLAAMGEVLRQSISWRATLSAAAGAAGLMIVLARLLVPDLEAAWVAVGTQMLDPFIEGGAAASAELQSALAQLAPYLTGLLAGIFLLSLTLSLLVARYWQALLYNPGAFGVEFRALQLGRELSIAAVALGLVGHLLSMPLATELAFVLGVLFFLQGLAVMHALTQARQMSSFWLVGMYVLLVIALPQMFLLLAALGVIDGVTRLRERFGARKSDSDPE